MDAANVSQMAGYASRPTQRQHLLATAARMGRRRNSPKHPRHLDPRTCRHGQGGPGRVARGRDIHPGEKRGFDVGKTKVGKGMKLEIVIDPTGLPLGMATASANISEQ